MRHFLEMFFLSLGVAAVSFFIGLLLRIFMKIDIKKNLSCLGSKKNPQQDAGQFILRYTQAVSQIIDPVSLIK